MKAQSSVLNCHSLTLILSLVVLFGFAVSPVSSHGGVDSVLPDPNAPSALITPVITYQGRLVVDGVPVNGARNMTFRLFLASTGGTAIWTEGPKSINVQNGLFTAYLGDTVPLNLDNMSSQLWLQVQVGATVLPRQQLTGAPYALSLAPGATIQGKSDSHAALLVANSGDAEGLIGQNTAAGPGLTGTSATGPGVVALGGGSGPNNPALYASNHSGAGPAASLVTKSNTAEALRLENQGTGPLIKGFGGDGGLDEFRVENDGTLASKADTYIFIPGSEAVPDLYSSSLKGDYYWAGGITFMSTGSCCQTVVIRAAFPSVLYGQNIKLKEITIYYGTENSANFIDAVHAYRQGAGPFSGTPWMSDDMEILKDPTNLNSTTFTGVTYAIPAYNVFSSTEGFVTVVLELYFNNTTTRIYLGGVSLRLGTHPDY
jgi:hypothetical protein